MTKTIYLLAFLILLTPPVFCQQEIESNNNFAVNLGYSKSFLTDDYISPNEYSGSSLLYGLSWGDNNYKRIVQIDVSFNEINELKNNISTATSAKFIFSYRHIFFISENSIFSKRFNFYLGPGLSVFFIDRTQNNIPMNSKFGFISVDLNAKGNILLSEKFSLSTQLLFSGLSLGNKSKSDIPPYDKSGYAILALFSLQNFEFDIRGVYDITDFIFVQAIYSFNYRKTSNWDYFRMTGDNLSFQLGISF